MSETLVDLDGTHNLRDIGGYHVSDGSTITLGRVFRSDHLNLLSDPDLEVLNSLGISSVFDFRGDREVELQPSRLWSAVETHVHLPIAGDKASPNGEIVQEKGFLEKVESGELTEVTEADVADTYISILETHGPKFVPVLEEIAARRGAVLFHCTAGKDRTGLAAALIHGLCGVSRDDIVHDFALSNQHRLPHRLAVLRPRFAALGIDIEPLIPALAAPESAMISALNHIESEHGGVHGYVTGTLAVEARTVELLQAALVG